MDKFKIESQWQFYLKKVWLTEALMHPEQLQQTKQAFFAAAGQMLILLRDDIAMLDEEEGIVHLENMLVEVTDFWMNLLPKN